MRTHRKAMSAACIAAVMTLSAGCSGLQGAGNDADSLTLSMSAAFPDLDPQHSTSTVNYSINFDNVYEGLVRLDGKTPEILPSLATKWEQVDPTTHRLTLRDGVKFHNGEPFDAEAAAFSVNRVLDDKGTAELRSYFSDFENAKAIDKSTVEIKTSRLVPDFLLNLTYIMMVPPKATQRDGLSEKPVGTGPYEFVSKTTDSAMYKPFDGYWGEKPPATKIKVVSRPEVASAVAGLLTGEIDIASDIPNELVNEVPAVRSAQVLEPVLLRLNSLSGITKDPKVRRALDLAIDSTTLREQFLGADYSSDPQCQLAPKGVHGHNPDLAMDEYDPAEAKALIENAGVEGQPIDIVGVQGRYPKGQEIVEAVMSQIEEVGLKPKSRILDLQGWLDQIYLGSDKAPEIALIGINVDQWTLFQPYSSIVSADSDLSNFPHKEFPKVQSLMDEAAETADETTRDDILEEAAAEICASDAFIWLYNYDQIWGTQEGITWDSRRDGRIVWSTIESD